MKKQPQVAVIGAGYWGVNLIRNFHALDSLALVCDADMARLDKISIEYPAVERAQRPEAFLVRPEIDAVVIATPAETHFQLAQAALQAGKDVFVEKPLCLRARDAEKLVSLARERKRILMVGHLLEYHPAILKLKEMVDAGELGRLQYVYSNRLNLGKVRREENILWSFAPHDITVILRLLGELPFEVSASGGAYLQPNLADVTVTNLLFDNGVRAHIFVSWLHPYKEQRLVVIGSDKMAVFDDVAKENKLMLYDQKVEWINGEPVPKRSEGVPIPFEKAEPLRAECQHFLDCITTRQTPRTDGLNGLHVLQVLEAAQRSLMTHGQPVSVTSQIAEVNAL